MPRHKRNRGHKNSHQEKQNDSQITKKASITAVGQFKSNPLEPDVQKTLSYLRANVPDDLSFEDQQKQMHFMKNMLEAYQPFVKECIEDPSKLQELQNKLASAISNDSLQGILDIAELLQSKQKSSSSDHFNLGYYTNALYSGVSNIFSGFNYSMLAAGSFLGLVSPTTAQAFTIHEGIPEGGMDMCAGFGRCIQGYIANSNDTSVAEFMRYIMNIDLKFDAAANWHLVECMDINKLGQVVIDTFGQLTNGVNQSASCEAVSEAYKEIYRIASKVDGIPLGTCADFTSHFTNAARSCMNPIDSVGYGWAIGGIAVGSILVCAGVAAAVYCCCKAGSKLCCC